MFDIVIIFISSNSRTKAMATIDRALHPENYQQKVVYDLDYLLESDQSRNIINNTGTPPNRLVILFVFMDISYFKRECF